MNDDDRPLMPGRYDEAKVTASRYSLMSDRKLMEFATGFNRLTETAQDLLREEFRRRSLALPVPKVDTPPEPDPPGLEPGYIPEPNDNAAPEHDSESRDDFAAEEAAERAVAEPQNLVTVSTFRDLPEAIVARNVLESSGIDCFLRDENTIRMDWLWSNMIGGLRLQVRSEDEVAARELLSQPMPRSFELDCGPDFEQPVCPKCGSLDVMANDTDRKIKAATTLISNLTLIVGLPALAMLRRDLWKCNNCGCKWYDDGERGPTLAPSNDGPLR